MKTLTPGAVETLRELRAGPMQTGPKSNPRHWVSGNSAAALLKKGLVERAPGFTYAVRLTDAGRAALDAYEGKPLVSVKLRSFELEIETDDAGVITASKMLVEGFES